MKVITVENQGPATSGAILPVAQGQTAVQDTTRTSIARMEDNLTRTEEIIRSSSQTQTQARIAGAAGEASNGGLGGFIQRGAEVTTQLMGRFVDIQQNELQRKKLKADEERRAAEAEAEKQRLIAEAKAKQAKAEQEALSNLEYANAQDEAQSIILQQNTEGTMVTVDKLNQLRTRYPNITDEQYAKLKSGLFNDVLGNDKDALRKISDKQDDYRHAALKAAEVTVKSSVGASLAQLKYEKDPAQQTKLVQLIDGQIRRAGSEHQLDTLQVLQLRNTVLAEAIDRTITNADTQAELNDTLGQGRKAWDELQKLEDLRGSGQLDEQSYRLARQDVLNKYPKAKVDQFLDIDGAKKLSYDRQALALGVQKLQQEGYEFANQTSTLANQDVAEQALAIMNDPSLRVNFEALDTGDNKRILELADTLEPIRKRMADPNRRVQLSNLNKTVQLKTSELQQIQQYAADPERYIKMKEAGLGVPSDISPEAQQRIMMEMQAAQEQYKLLVQGYQQDGGVLAQYGVVYDDASGKLGLDQAVSTERTKAKSAAPPPQGKGQAPPAASGLPAGFNPGWGGLPVPAPAQQTAAGARGSQATVKFVSPVREVYQGHLYDESPPGSWDFTLIDNQGSDITNIPSPVTGIVTEAGTRGGYGNVVAVKDEKTGREWFMAHLNQPAYLKVGQRVTAGQPLAQQGTSGNSTGPHIHLEILHKPYSQGGYTDTNRKTTEPLVREYFSRATSGNWPQTAPRGAGLPPSQQPITGSIATHYKLTAPNNAPPGSLILPGGAYLFGGKITFPKMTKVSAPNTPTPPKGGSPVSASRPLPNGRMSALRGDYPTKNDPEANYGYESLAKDKAFARALAGVGDRVGFPSQWLADVMAVESNQGFMHNPGARNSEGAVGLIQFYPGGGLADVAQEMGVSEAVASQRLGSMTRAQQMPWVEFYLKKQLQYTGRKKYDRMEDVFAAIWGGSSMLGKPVDQRGGNDSNVDYGGYLNLIGSHAGRAYNHHLLRGGVPTHTSYVKGCPTCERMMKNGGTITPHAAPN